MNQIGLGPSDYSLRHGHRACAIQDKNTNIVARCFKVTQLSTSRHETSGIQRNNCGAHAKQGCPPQRKAENKSWTSPRGASLVSSSAWPR